MALECQLPIVLQGFGNLLKAPPASDLTCWLADRQRQPRVNSSAFHGSRMNLEVPS